LIPLNGDGSMKFMNSPIITSSDLPLPKQPWRGAAQDEKARIWREKHTTLVTSIQESCGLSPFTKESQQAKVDCVLTEQDFYSLMANPTDRTFFVAFLGHACVHADRDTDIGIGGLGIAHILAAQLIIFWTRQAWFNTQPPSWAVGLLGYILNDDFDHGDGLTDDIAVRDFETFLDAHKQNVTENGAGAIRSNRREWNQSTIDACSSWRLLASLSPGKVPNNLIDKIAIFEGNYEPDDRHREARLCTMASWERHILEGEVLSSDETVNHTDQADQIRRLM
jgi:hypothetical protein